MGGGNQNLDLGVTVVYVKLAGARCAALVVSVRQEQLQGRQAKAPLPQKVRFSTWHWRSGRESTARFGLGQPLWGSVYVYVHLALRGNFHHKLKRKSAKCAPNLAGWLGATQRAGGAHSSRTLVAGARGPPHWVPTAPLN